MANFIGTTADDFYIATPEGDRASGWDGNDTLIGNVGTDVLDGGNDNDVLASAPASDLTTTTTDINNFRGNHTLLGGSGNDTLVGAISGFSSDLLAGNADNDLLIASNSGSSTLLGGQGDDIIYGGLLDDNYLNGNSGDDLLVAGLGNDTMLGGSGNDTLVGGIGSNDFFGGEGVDKFQFLSKQENTLSVLISTEQVLRSDGGFGGSDTIYNFGANDRIAIADLDRNSVVTISTNILGDAVITIAGTAEGQAANQTITVTGITGEQLLLPETNSLAIDNSFVNTTNISITDGLFNFIVQ